MTVIVTDTDYRMTLPLIRDLADAGYTVVATYRNNCVGGMSKGVSAVYKCDSPYEICKKYDMPTLLCVGRETIEEVSSDREKYDGVCHVLVPEREILDRANDKSYVLSLAQSIGIPTPGEPTAYPCIAKFPCGEKLGLKASERYFVVKDETEHTSLKNKYPDLIFQQMIEGDGVGVCMIMKGGKCLDYISHRRIRECPLSGGPSSCCVTHFDEKLIAYSEKLLAALSFEGIAMVEWKGGVLMEINPRVWGSYALTRISKSKFSQNWALSSAGENTLESHPLPDRKMTFFTSEIKLILAYIRKKNFKKVLEIIKDTLNPRVKDGIIDLHDLKGTFSYIKSIRSNQ